MKGKLTGRKDDSEKIRMELLSVPALRAMAEVMTKGAIKYDDYNWLGGMKHSRLYGAALRHLTAHMDGEDLDEETELSHLAHAGCCLMMLSTYEIKGLGEDDRPRVHNLDKIIEGVNKLLTEPCSDGMLVVDGEGEADVKCYEGCQCSRQIDSSKELIGHIEDTSTPTKCNLLYRETT